MDTPTPTPFWKQPHIYVTLMFMVPIYFVVFKVVGDTTNAFSDTIKVMVITAIISTAVGAILGFWMGSSQSSAKKDDANAALASQLAVSVPPQAAAQLAASTPPTPVLGAGPTGTPDDPVAVTEVKT